MAEYDGSAFQFTETDKGYLFEINKTEYNANEKSDFIKRFLLFTLLIIRTKCYGFF